MTQLPGSPSVGGEGKPDHSMRDVVTKSQMLADRIAQRSMVTATVKVQGHEYSVQTEVTTSGARRNILIRHEEQPGELSCVLSPVDDLQIANGYGGSQDVYLPRPRGRGALAASELQIITFGLDAKDIAGALKEQSDILLAMASETTTSVTDIDAIFDTPPSNGGSAIE